MILVRCKDSHAAARSSQSRQGLASPGLDHFPPLGMAGQEPGNHKDQTAQSCRLGATDQAPHNHMHLPRDTQTPGPPGIQCRTGPIFSHYPSAAVRTACSHVGGQTDSANATVSTPYWPHTGVTFPEGLSSQHVHAHAHVCACGLAARHT